MCQHLDLVEELKQSIKEDLPTIDQYIDTYAFDGEEYESALGRDRMHADEILGSVWAKNKVDLYKLLGNRLMAHKHISIQEPEHELSKKIRSLLYENQFIRDFEEKVLQPLFEEGGSAFYSFYSDLPEEKKDIVSFHKFFQYSISEAALLRNSMIGIQQILGKTFVCPDGTKIQIPQQIKTFRLLNKLAKAYNIESFENFRIAYSQIFNDSKLTGQLTLSIHPLDYMTMSDNNCGWGSCMSWIDQGDYRLGTVEMMNSPYVIVAYLEAQDPFDLWNDYDRLNVKEDCKLTWSNKKWRCLFIVDEGYLIKVKGYPYQCQELENEVFKFLMELAEKNCGWTYYPDDIDLISEHQNISGRSGDITVNFHFCTNSMYNDMYHNAKSHCRISDKEQFEELRNGTTKSINYSGPTQCMWCGGTEIIFDNEQRLLCCSEYSGVHCEHCGEHISGDEIYYDSEGYPYCENCYYEFYVQDFTTGSDIDRSQADIIFVIPQKIWEKLQCTYIGESSLGELPKYAFDKEFLTQSGVPYVYTENYNLYDGTNDTEKNIKWLKNHAPHSYFVKCGITPPKVAQDRWGDLFFYYVYDPDDEEFLHSRLGRDIGYTTYLGYASEKHQGAYDYKHDWNDKVKWHCGHLSGSGVDYKDLLFTF